MNCYLTFRMNWRYYHDSQKSQFSNTKFVKMNIKNVGFRIGIRLIPLLRGEV